MHTEQRPDNTLHVGCPNLGDREVFNRLVDELFERRWFTNAGQLVRQLEEQLSTYLGVRHCIPVCNGTVGLQLACHALDLSGEVIVPANTFVATPHALQWERLKPIFADANLSTHNIDPECIETLITADTSAILGVHVWGRPCDTTRIDTIAKKHGLTVLYDAAHAFGCRHQGQMIGNFGRCEVFSFHATKFFNTFEGGAIATNDDALADKIRLMKNFGFAKMDNVIHLGTNAKMTEICAAMGLACFVRLDEIVAANQSNYKTYRESLQGIPGVELLSYDDLEGTNWQYIIVEVDQDTAGVSRDQVLQTLHDHHVLARRYFYPGCHRMEPYQTLYPKQTNRLPITDLLCQRVLCLPTGTSITTDNIRQICHIIRHAVHQ